MSYGNMPIDNGYLIVSDKDAQNAFKEHEVNRRFLRHYIGGDELINKTHKWCIWLKDISPENYQYSASVVYNTFPWPSPSDEQKKKIEQTAQTILDTRNLYPDSSLADLYDETFMPPELRKAHQENDKAIMRAYGFYKKDESEKYNEAKDVPHLHRRGCNIQNRR